MLVKVNKVVAKTAVSGKKYWLVYCDGQVKEASSFDSIAPSLVGQEVEATLTDGQYGPKITFSKGSGQFVKEGGEKQDSQSASKTIGTTLSYAKDVLTAIIVSYMNTHPDYPVDAALEFIKDSLPQMHEAFLAQTEVKNS